MAGRQNLYEWQIEFADQSLMDEMTGEPSMTGIPTAVQK